MKTAGIKTKHAHAIRTIIVACREIEKKNRTLMGSGKKALMQTMTDLERLQDSMHSDLSVQVIDRFLDDLVFGKLAARWTR